MTQCVENENVPKIIIIVNTNTLEVNNLIVSAHEHTTINLHEK